MTSSLLTKSALGAAGLGTATTGAIYLGTDLLKSKKTVSELIRDLKKDKRLISAKEESDPKWKAAWKHYRESNNTRNQDEGTVRGGFKVDGAIEEVDAPKDFIDKCKSKSSRKIVDEKDSLFSQVVSYCTRDTLVSDLIEEYGNGKKLLVKGSDFANDKDWKAVWDLYRKDNDSASKDRGEVGKADGSSKKVQTVVPAEFADECLKKAQVPEYRTENLSYTDVLKYCTK